MAIDSALEKLQKLRAKIMNSWRLGQKIELDEFDLDQFMEVCYAIEEHQDFRKFRPDMPIILVDFDGTLTDYKDTVSDGTMNNTKLMPGAIQWLRQAIKVSSVYIFSSRANTRAGRWAIIDFLKARGVPADVITRLHIVDGKPPAAVVIDDRAWRFNGDWDTMAPPEEMLRTKPWYYKVSRH